MIRTQISLEPADMERLRKVARARGVSIAAVVRESVVGLLDEAEMSDRRSRALAASGRFSGGGSGRHHDDAFEE